MTWSLSASTIRKYHVEIDEHDKSSVQPVCHEDKPGASIWKELTFDPYLEQKIYCTPVLDYQRLIGSKEKLCQAFGTCKKPERFLSDCMWECLENTLMGRQVHRCTVCHHEDSSKSILEQKKSHVRREAKGTCHTSLTWEYDETEFLALLDSLWMRLLPLACQRRSYRRLKSNKELNSHLGSATCT